MSKLTRRLAALFVSAAIVFTIGSARAEGEDVGARLHCRLVAGSADWALYNRDGTETKPAINGSVVFDLGTPHIVDYSFLAGDTLPHNVWGSNSLDNYTTYSQAGSGWTKIYSFSSGTKGSTYWPTRIAGTEGTAYRYYLFQLTGSKLNVHLRFFSKDLVVSQDNVVVLPKTSALGSEDLGEGVKFSGTVDNVPNEGEATVTLYVAKSDHDDDLAAWQADATRRTFVADGTYATGAKYEIYATDLPQGVWFGRVFATASETSMASQRSAEFAVGTVPYYPPAYVPSSVSDLKYYDGNTATYANNEGAYGFYLLVDDDPDMEVVGLRAWARQNASYIAGGAFAEVAEADLDFGVITPVSSVTARTLFTTEKWPTGGTGLGSFYSKLDFFDGYPALPFDVPIHPTRFKKYLRLSGATRDGWAEVELRALPRPPEPEATMSLGEPGGTFVGLSGYLTYRGNANKSSCSIYVSCVKTGEDADYKLLATNWENATDWSGAVTGLEGETDYSINVIVSNELAGVQVLSDSFRTLEAADEPPTIELTGAVPDDEANVTFSWNLTNFGSAGDDVDVYAKWGPDLGNLCAGVKIAEHVAIGNGAAKCEQVEAGADLVFVIYAVNNDGSDEDGTRTSADTSPIEGTTPGPGSFKTGSTLTRENITGAIRAKGELAALGLGENIVEAVYALVGSTETNTIVVSTIQKGESLQFDKSFTFPVEGNVYCRLQVVTSGKGKTWRVAADEKTFVSGTRLPSHFSYSRVYLGDGDLTSKINNNFGPFTLDLGNLHTVRGAWIAYDSASACTKNTSLWSSGDNVNWTKVMDYPLASAVSGTLVDFVFTNVMSNVRYLQLRGTGSKRMDTAEFHAIGSASDLVVSAERVQAWGSKTGTGVPADAADDPQGVYFSGKLVSGGPAHVYACLSRKNLDADANAWLKATHKDLGEFASGEEISGYLPGATPGHYFGKLIAVREGDGAKVVSPQVLRTVVGTKTFPNEILIDASAIGKAAIVYDGLNANYASGSGPSAFIFPIKNLGGLVPASVRLWPDAGQAGSLWSARISVSSNQVEIAANDYRDVPKPIKTFASLPAEIAWTQIASFGNLDDFVGGDKFWEIPLVKPQDKAVAAVLRNATYIRIDSIELNRCAEMELRLLRPSGMVFRVR